MPRRPATFQQDDIKRAVAGAEAAGKVVHTLEVKPTGEIMLDFTPNLTTRGKPNGIDAKQREKKFKAQNRDGV